jgi:hypothetical protein
MVAPLVISLQQHIPFPKLHAPTPRHSVCVCISSGQDPALVVHRGWSVSVTLTPASLTQLIKGLLQAQQPSVHTWTFEAESLEAVADLLWNKVKAQD